MPSGINKAVQLSKTILALLLALAWVPLSLHCQIETMPGWEFLSCEAGEEDHSPPHQSSDCEDDFCQVVESGLYKIEEHTILLPRQDWTPLPLEALLVTAPPAGPRLTFPTPTASPPALAVSWQFSLRTALPVRAPSLVS